MEQKTKRVLSWAATVTAYTIFLAMLIFMVVCIMYSCHEMGKKIADRGLKNIVEEVWEGKQNQGD